jgi:tetrahydromethanopterin S-methyltransferase subunit F
MMISDPATVGVIEQLMQEYGLTGLAFGILLAVFMRQNKVSGARIRELEISMQRQQTEHVAAHKEMVDQYVELVRSKTQVLADLTGCLKAIKNTLDRIER